MRRLFLRTLLLSLLAIGIASAARVKHTVDLPTNPLHWQRYLKTLRSVLATQRLALRYDVGNEIKYADSEDYFRAAPAYNKPADIPTDIVTLLILLVILLSVQYGARYTTCECTILDTPPHE